MLNITIYLSSVNNAEPIVFASDSKYSHLVHVVCLELPDQENKDYALLIHRDFAHLQPGVKLEDVQNLMRYPFIYTPSESN